MMRSSVLRAGPGSKNVFRCIARRAFWRETIERAARNDASLIAAEFEFVGIQSNGFARLAVRAIGLIDEFTRSPMTFGQSFIRLIKRDFPQGHP